MKPAARLATILLSLVALAHLARLLLGVEIVADGVVIPLWFSALGFLVPGGIALALWRESRRE